MGALSDRTSMKAALATGRIGMAGDVERRWESLDALRGIAAFLVLTFHCSSVFTGFVARSNPFSLSAWQDPWTWLKFTPLRLFVSAGPSAVVLFFVLSGFVLSLPFLRSVRQPGYSAFVIKRVCRIYPPFAAAILISAALCVLVEPASNPALSAWFNEVLPDRVLSMEYILRNLMMTGLVPDMSLDTVMWSLVHELRISLIFPILFVLTRRWPAASVPASLLVGLACTAALAGKDVTDLAMSLVDTARFIPLFVAGIVIAAQAGTIRQATARLSRSGAAILWLASMALMLFPGQSISDYYDFVWGLGAVTLLVMTVGSVRADRVFSASPLVWLGRVSYSLYLVHVPLLIVVVHLTYGRAPLWVAVAGVIPLSLVAAELMYRFIEKPSIGLGRRLSKPRRYTTFPMPGTVWPSVRRDPP
jgi:peptidoglycan/LPS O-acetylase OafA/YrhL